MKFRLLLLIVITLKVSSSDSIKYEFLPHNSKKIYNLLPIDIRTECKFYGKMSELLINFTKESGILKLNNEIVFTNINVTIPTNSTLIIERSAFSSIVIKNLGENILKAECNLIPKTNLAKSLKTGIFEFKPKEIFTITNPLFFSVNSYCQIFSKNIKKANLSIRMKNGIATINRENIGKGINIESRYGNYFEIEANADSIVEVYNKGNAIVIAKCQLAESFSEKIKFLYEFINGNGIIKKINN